MLPKFLVPVFLSALAIGSGCSRAIAQPTAIPPVVQPTVQPIVQPTVPIDIPPALQSSPTLKKWLQQVPNIQDEIVNDPSFKTRVRFGYSRFTQGNQDGILLGLDDLRLGKTPITLSGSYGTSASLSSWGIEIQSYLLPLGGYVNLAPVVGFRSIATSTTQAAGLNLGAKLLLVPSRGGGADIALQQTWVGLGTDQEVGIGKFSVGYAIAPKLRIATDLERWQGRSVFETRASLLLEWMP